MRLNYKKIVDEYELGGLYVLLGAKYGVNAIKKRAGTFDNQTVFNRLKRNEYFKNNKIVMESWKNTQTLSVELALAGAVGAGWLTRS